MDKNETPHCCRDFKPGEWKPAEEQEKQYLLSEKELNKLLALYEEKGRAFGIVEGLKQEARASGFRIMVFLMMPAFAFGFAGGSLFWVFV